MFWPLPTKREINVFISDSIFFSKKRGGEEEEEEVREEEGEGGTEVRAREECDEG